MSSAPKQILISGTARRKNYRWTEFIFRRVSRASLMANMIYQATKITLHSWLNIENCRRNIEKLSSWISNIMLLLFSRALYASRRAKWIIYRRGIFLLGLEIHTRLFNGRLQTPLSQCHTVSHLRVVITFLMIYLKLSLIKKN